MSDLGGTLIDIAIGLTLVYLVLSLVVSGAQEWVAQLFHLRSANLRKGIINLMGDAKTQAFYNHGLIKGLYDHKRNRLPSYIPADRFAETVCAVFNLPGTDEDLTKHGALADYIETNIDAPDHFKEALVALARRGENRISAFQDEVAKWYDDSMERVSGWYARRIRWVGLAVAAIVVVTMNADSLRIAQTIWQSQVLRETLAASAQIVATQESPKIDERTTNEVLNMLPLGWPCEIEVTQTKTADGVAGPTMKAPVCVFSNAAFDTPMAFALKVLGWLITIFACTLGAPFWFDLLKRISKLRAGGGNPAERPTGSARTART
jgi:hypothetical protein